MGEQELFLRRKKRPFEKTADIECLFNFGAGGVGGSCFCFVGVMQVEFIAT